MGCCDRNERHRWVSYVAIACLALYGMFPFLKQDGWVTDLKHIPSIDRFASCKAPCQYCQQTPGNTVEVNMTSFRGGGRTGNYIISLNKAIDLAISCKKTIAMPRTDDRSKALMIDSSCHVLNFSGRSGPENMFCQNISFPVSGDMGYFWRLGKSLVLKMVKDRREEYTLAKSRVDVQTCLRHYLGLCNNAYCQFEPKNPLNVSSNRVLVAHLREGDIFKSNFSSAVHGGYGQPPLSYYLQAIDYRHWHSIIVVTQPGNVGPIRSGLMMLNQTMQVPIHLQMSSWYNDLRTLLCAPALVTSKSSLEGLLKLGFALEIFGYQCLGTSQAGKDYLRIPVNSYSPFSKHTNSPTEWLQTLLHSSPPPEKC